MNLSGSNLERRNGVNCLIWFILLHYKILTELSMSKNLQFKTKFGASFCNGLGVINAN
jgi:hypothetical protein